MILSQEAAVRYEHDKQRSEKLEKRGRKSSTDNGNTLSPGTLKIKRQSVSFAEECTSSEEPTAATSMVVAVVDRSDDDMTVAETSLDTPPCQEEKSNGNGEGHGKGDRVIKSGHAHTHDIVINLDDKIRYSEEVTV